MAFMELLNKSFVFLKGVVEEIGLSIAVATIILLAGLIIGKLLGKLTKKVLHEVEVDSILTKATRIEVNLENILTPSIEDK